MAKVTTKHYVLPRNPDAPTFTFGDIFQSEPWQYQGGHPQWIVLNVSRRHTSLPDPVTLGDAARMFVVPMWKGLLLTPTQPRNEFFATMKEVMGGYLTAVELDALMPGLGVLAASHLHGAADAAEGAAKDRAELMHLANATFEAVPIVDIVEIDWRDYASLWNPIQHLSLSYAAPGETPKVCTLVGTRLNDWPDLVLKARFLAECEIAFERAKSEFMAPVSRPIVAKYPGIGTITLGELKAMMDEVQTAWTGHLAQHPEITNAAFWRRAKEALPARMPAYKDLPGFEWALQQFDDSVRKMYGASAA